MLRVAACSEAWFRDSSYETFGSAFAPGLVTGALENVLSRVSQNGLFSVYVRRKAVNRAMYRLISRYELAWHAYDLVSVYTTASVTSATPRADPRIYRSGCSQSARCKGQ